MAGVAALILTLAGAAYAQDAHYWTLQYGTKAELLGGMVVGSIKDLSSTFYNPGAVAFSIDQGLLFTTDAAELSRCDLQSDETGILDSSDTRLVKSPGMFAMRFPFDLVKGQQIALSYLTRQRFELEFSDNRVYSWWDPGWGADDRSIAGKFRMSENLGENWFGASWAQVVRDRLALGVTLYGAYRSQSMRTQTIIQGAQTDGPGASATVIRESSYWNVRGILKAGASFDYRPLAFGAALTLPSLDLFGKGKTFYNDAVINIDLDADGIPDSYLASDLQEGLSASYRSPFSISAGVSYGYKKSTIHISAEYFAAIGLYDVLKPAGFVSQASGDSLSTRVTGGAKSVFNIGIGADYRFGDRFSLYAGITTDKSAGTGEVTTALATWDLYHMNIGGAFRALDIDWTLGLGYTWGGGEADIDAGIAGGGSGPMIGAGSFAARMDYTKLKLIIGIGFPTEPRRETSG
jgi:hypothetical protein